MSSRCRLLAFGSGSKRRDVSSSWLNWNLMFAEREKITTRFECNTPGSKWKGNAFGLQMMRGKFTAPSCCYSIFEIRNHNVVTRFCSGRISLVNPFWVKFPVSAGEWVVSVCMHGKQTCVFIFMPKQRAALLEDFVTQVTGVQAIFGLLHLLPHRPGVWVCLLLQQGSHLWTSLLLLLLHTNTC